MSKVINDAIEGRKIEICKAFNKKPKDGIAIIKGICGDAVNPHSLIADFLIKNKDNLDPAEVGDYLGTEGSKTEARDGAEEQKTENEQVLAHFVGRMEFKGKTFVDALRGYLKEFKLPGEAQKIDRLMEAFGDLYIKQNPECGIDGKDAAYVLAFQAIMLNTDLHNASIAPAKKMSLSGLKNNLRGVNNKNDFPPEFLEKVYNDIKSKPFEFVNPSKISVELDQDDQNLRQDPAFKKYNSEAKKPWYSFLTSSTTTSRLQDESGAVARMTISEPSWFGKLIGKKSGVIIRPGEDDQAPPSDLDNKLVAKTAAEFTTDVRMTTTYPYQTTEMKEEYDKARTGNNVAAQAQKEQAKAESLGNTQEVVRAVAQLKKIGVGGEVPTEPEKRGRMRIGVHRKGGKS